MRYIYFNILNSTLDLKPHSLEARLSALSGPKFYHHRPRQCPQTSVAERPIVLPRVQGNGERAHIAAVLERAGRAGCSGSFSLAAGVNGGDASALVVAAMICSWSAMIRSKAPRAQA